MASNPTQAQASTLDLFRDRLPPRPYSTNDLAGGVSIRKRQSALSYRWIQANGPHRLYWLVFDVDRRTAALDWHDRDCPPPTITAQNPTNGHAHLFYGLGVSVRTAPDGKEGPLRYAAAVEAALREKLDADRGYTGLLAKNPTHPCWRVEQWQESLYDLPALDSWLDLAPYKDRRKKFDNYGLGRNCNLFNDLRRWAYREKRINDWPSYQVWFDACLEQALAFNLTLGLGVNEVKATAKSVAGWTWKHMTESAFSALQARRGSLKGRKTRMASKAEVVKLSNLGRSVREIAAITGLSKSTVHDWLKQ